MFTTYAADVDRCFRHRPPEDRKDLVQDVFVTAMVRIHTFQGDREAALRAWLRSIAFHRWHHRWEAEQVRQRYQGPALEHLMEMNPSHSAFRDQSTDPAQAVAEKEQVRNLLGQLTPRQAQVVHAHVIEGRSTRDIADSWGVPRERVRGLYKRGMARLRSPQRALRPA